ncbi:MAG: Radical domain protein [Oscillospiraceae bacterium]|nr:Radical domain protein [Oscillospiraceae bacterium]
MKHSNIAIFIPHVGCPHTCSFCNQKTISGTGSSPTCIEIEEICQTALRQVSNPEDTEIAFFGGSFTAIERSEMIVFLEAASKFVGKGLFAGIRVSTRPDAIDDGILEILKSYGVTSIELGVQSLDNEVLKKNNRGHTSEQVYTAACLIREYGFSLGLQMMVGLFGDSKESVYLTAQEFLALKPDTVRIYPVVVLKGTKLEQLFKSGEYVPFSFEKAVDICSELLYLFYENGINVIRMGLHASENVEDQMVAGIYHPAFREICENKIYYNQLCKQLINKPKGRYEVVVHPKCLSKAIGQKRKNSSDFVKLGYHIIFKPQKDVAQYEVKVLKEV